MTDSLKLVTYCGLYGGLCFQRGRIPQRAKALREAMNKEGYEFWGKNEPRPASPMWTFAAIHTISLRTDLPTYYTVLR